MKIAQIATGLINIPPKGWGALEEVIWQYKRYLELKGHIVDIKGFMDTDLNEYDVVHVHIGDQALALHKKNVPYIFTTHDTHSYYLGKNSKCFIDNNLAIKNSVVSTASVKFIKNYFDNGDKIMYLPYGVDTDFYQPVEKKGHNLLCVGSKDYRKQFKYAVIVAMNLNMPITIVGPEFEDKIYLESIKNLNYDKLTIIGNSDKKTLRDIHNEHTIVIHPALLEFGHPCVALIEVLSSGLPIAMSPVDDDKIDGTIFIDRNVESITKAVIKMINNYDEYSKKAREFALKRDWSIITDDLLKIYEQYRNMK